MAETHLFAELPARAQTGGRSLAATSWLKGSWGASCGEKTAQSAMKPTRRAPAHPVQ